MYSGETLVLEFLQHSIEVVLQSPHIMADMLAARGSIGLLYEGAAVFKGLPQLLKPSFEFLVWVLKQDGRSKSQTDLQSLAFTTIMELCMQNKGRTGEAEFNILFNFLHSHFRTLKTDSLGIITQSVCILCSELPNEVIP